MDTESQRSLLSRLQIIAMEIDACLEELRENIRQDAGEDASSSLPLAVRGWHEEITDALHYPRHPEVTEAPNAGPPESTDD